MRAFFILAPMLRTAVEATAASICRALDAEAAKPTTGALLLFQ